VLEPQALADAILISILLARTVTGNWCSYGFYRRNGICDADKQLVDRKETTSSNDDKQCDALWVDSLFCDTCDPYRDAGSTAAGPSVV
jgi:hypothetical protein